MPSIINELNDLLSDDRDENDKTTALRQENRVRRYNIGQLRGLHRELGIQMKGMHDSVLKSANQLLMERIDKELTAREAMLAAEQARREEELNRQERAREEAHFRQKEKRAVQKMFATQAKFRATQEIHAEEAQHYIEERTYLVHRRLSAKRKRSVLYALGLGSLGAAVGLTVWSWRFGGLIAIPLVVVALGFYWIGRKVGDSWHIKVTADKDLLVKIEDRETVILKNLKEGHKKLMEEEKRKKEEEKRERRRKRQEQRAKKEAERKAMEEAIVKDMEEGATRARLIAQQQVVEEEAPVSIVVLPGVDEGDRASDVSDGESCISGSEGEEEELEGVGKGGRRRRRGSSGRRASSIAVQEETKEEKPDLQPAGEPPPPSGAS